MDIYNKLCETISHLRILVDSKIPYQTLEYFLSTTVYPQELKLALCTNPEWSLKILSRYKEITIHYIKNKISLEKLIKFVVNNFFDKIDTKIKDSEKQKLINL